MWCNDKERNKKGHLRDAEDSTEAGTVRETVRGEEIVRASSVPLSVGAQILLHYLSSSADNSYSQRYVRSVFSLTSALMLLNVAHSRVGTRVDTCCCTVSSLPPFLSLSLSFVRPSCSKCILSHLHPGSHLCIRPRHKRFPQPAPVWLTKSLQTGEVAAVTFRAANPAVRQKLRTACSR